MDKAQQKGFDRIFNLPMGELTSKAGEVLEKKYPKENWDPYNFPAYVYTSDSVEVGYKIAVKEYDFFGGLKAEERKPGLLGTVKCYCFCDVMGHKNLLHCFWKDGKVDDKFDDHAANCNIFYGQAMLAFLLAEVGANEEEIIKGMEKNFERLVKARKKIVFALSAKPNFLKLGALKCLAEAPPLSASLCRLSDTKGKFSSLKREENLVFQDILNPYTFDGLPYDKRLAVYDGQT